MYWWWKLPRTHGGSAHTCSSAGDYVQPAQQANNDQTRTNNQTVATK
jgi:hypothetical protein